MRTMNKDLSSLYLKLLGKEFEEMDTTNKRDFVQQIVDELCNINNLPQISEITFNNINKDIQTLDDKLEDANVKNSDIKEINE